jgi:ABC-type oligopeptide transport system ATPase subunit
MKEIILGSTSNTAKKKPVVISWGKNSNGEPAKMVRNHSIRACVNEILEFSSRIGMVRINIVGASGSGKTSLAETIAHLCHTMADVPYDVKLMKKEDLVDFTATIKQLSSNHQVLVFDDLSWLGANFGKKEIEKLKAEITTVRHIDDHTDRRIILIMNFHAQKALDKFLRIANFTFYSSCSPEEVGYLVELLGKKYTRKIELFRRLKIQALGQGRFSFPLGKNDSYTYKAFDPFLPYLFSNGDFCRFVVSPLRTWIDEKCHVCDPVVEETKVNIDDFVDDFSRKFTKGNAKKAVELKLLQNGISTQTKRVLQAMKYIDMFLAQRKVNLHQLAERFDLEEKSGLHGINGPKPEVSHV